MESNEKNSKEDIIIKCSIDEIRKHFFQDYLYIERSIEDILTTINQNLQIWEKKSPSRKNLPAFAPIFDDCDKSSLNHIHRYLKVIPNFKNRLQAKDDFVTLAKAIYSSDAKTLKSIEEFAETYKEYNQSEILRWYTKPAFLHELLNNSLRIANSDSIQYSRFVLKDLEKAIKQHYQEKSKTFSGLLYRGAFLSNEEWLGLKENQGREIEMHGFLSASKDKNVALSFMEYAFDPSKMVLITIIVPKGPNEEEQGFADIEEFSCISKEKEVLFNVRSRFTVLETEDEYSPELPYRHLVLLYGAQGFRKFLAEQNSVLELSFPSLKNHSCDSCKIATYYPRNVLFTSISNPQNELYYCKRCFPRLSTPLLCVSVKDTPTEIKLKGYFLTISSEEEIQVPFYGYQCSECQVKNKKLYFSCTDCRKRLCEYCFPYKSSCLKSEHLVVAENTPFSYWFEKMSKKEESHMKFQNSLVINNDNPFQQGEMFFESHEYEKAIKFYNAYIEQNAVQEDDQLATCLGNLELLYFNQGQYEKALEYHQKSLDIIEKLFSPGNYPDIATSKSNLGKTYSRLGRHQEALLYFRASLDIRKSMYGDNHNDVAASYEQIGDGNLGLKQYEKALDNYSLSLQIKTVLYGDRHPEIAALYKRIGEVYRTQDDPRSIGKMLDYLFMALERFQTPYGKNHPLVADAYDSMGELYHKQGKPFLAIEEYEKALSIRKSFSKKNPIGLITSYKNLGLASYASTDYEKAQESYAKALEVAEEFYGKDHLQTLEIKKSKGQAQAKKEAMMRKKRVVLKNQEIVSEKSSDIEV